ncbi:MAG: UDP-N-acetylmuramoyl-tripeptide--D-alanyl-D-alanine ligase [Nonlabens sp.]
MQELYTIFKNSKGVSTDTRSLEEEQMFFALSGENFNANNFVETALTKGAFHVVCNDKAYESLSKVTVVEDPLKTLQELATYYRKQFKFPILALTGSNGKTTTKELILSVLSQKLEVKGTAGNYNNHIGVPLTLLSFNEDLDIGIVEMGANHQKEIEFLCSIARPDYGMITNYGKAHLEGFGGIEGIKKGKSEMYDYLRENNKRAFIARWDQEQISRSKGINCIKTTDKCVLRSSDPYVKLTYQNQSIEMNVTGDYNYNNALFAITIGEHFSVPSQKIIQGLESYVPSNNRSQIIKHKDYSIILDAYNANPSSMKVALENLARQKEGSRSAVLGDMFELGAYSEKEHQKIADLASELKLNEVYFIGSHFFNVKTSYERFETFEDFENYFKSLKKKGLYLIKGSRGMKLERSLELFD